MALRVFLQLRLPRVLMATAGGFGLGVAGFIYQTVFCNPLASPDIIGVSSGASVGAAFAILFVSSSALSATFFAFICGLLAVCLALTLANLSPQKNPATVVLAGIAVHSLAQTALMALKLCADPEKELASIEYWMMGSLASVTANKIPVNILLICLSTAVLFLLHRQTLMLSVEETEARILGLSVGRLRVCVLLLATLAVASVISVTGLISFIGLLAPHTTRLLTRQNTRTTLLLSGFCGSLLLLAADTLAKGIAASELPVSIFTSLLGAPFLLYLILSRRKESL